MKKLTGFLAIPFAVLVMCWLAFAGPVVMQQSTGGGAGVGDFLADGTVPMTGALIPNAVNTIALGSAAAEWADLFLGDGAVIYGQNDSSATLTSSASKWTANNFGVTTAMTLPATLSSAAAVTWTLMDNQASGLSFGATGAADILKVGTLDAGPTVAVAGNLSATTYGSTGTVTDAELLYLADVTSAIQAQFSAKAPVTAPVFLTSIESPFLILDSAATAADAGAIRMANNTNIAWELAATGADVTFGVNSTDDMVAALVAVTDLFKITTGNLFVGAGTPTQTQDGADAYVTGMLEVDGMIYADGGITSGSISTAAGNITATLGDITGARVIGTSTASSLVANVSNDTPATSGSLDFWRARAGSANVADDDVLGEIRFKGQTAGGVESGAIIRAVVNGTPGSGDLPSELIFATSADGSATPTTWMTINSAGSVLLSTSLESPFLILGSTATAADAGAIRMANNTNIAWELAATGTDVTFGVNSTDDMVAALVAVTDLFKITTGNLFVGAGTPTQTQDGADAYVTGMLEVDGMIHADGGVTGALTGNASTATLAATSTIADSSDASSYLVMVDSATGSLALKTDPTVLVDATTGIITAGGYATTRVASDSVSLTNAQFATYYEDIDDGNHYRIFRMPNLTSTHVQLEPVGDPTAGQVKAYGVPAGDAPAISTGTWVTPALARTEKLATFSYSGGGSAIAANTKLDAYIPAASTITGWVMLSTTSCSMVVDIWSQAYADFPPEVGQTIIQSEPPTLTTAYMGQDLSLAATWTEALAAGVTLRANVDSSDCTGNVSVTLIGTIP